MTAYRVQYQGFTGTITKSFDSQEQAETWVAEKGLETVAVVKPASELPAMVVTSTSCSPIVQYPTWPAHHRKGRSA
ncbi:MAG TPA: hypothetical protein VN039_15895 [Nitrospira sp.]|jgi:viroplasmin and RNaseH domain-containing protein|nr:hypothetical protein [Nitrospira sp.]